MIFITKNSKLPIGEVHQFDWELFKNSDDTNIQLLVKLMETVDQTYQSIQNINAIKIDKEEEESFNLPPPRFLSSLIKTSENKKTDNYL